MRSSHSYQRTTAGQSVRSWSGAVACSAAMPAIRCQRDSCVACCARLQVPRSPRRTRPWSQRSRGWPGSGHDVAGRRRSGPLSRAPCSSSSGGQCVGIGVARWIGGRPPHAPGGWLPSTAPGLARALRRRPAVWPPVASQVLRPAGLLAGCGTSASNAVSTDSRRRRQVACRPAAPALSPARLLARARQALRQRGVAAEQRRRRWSPAPGPPSARSASATCVVARQAAGGRRRTASASSSSSSSPCSQPRAGSTAAGPPAQPAGQASSPLSSSGQGSWRLSWRNWSIAWCQATRYSQAAACAGTPSTGQRSSARRQATCTASSASARWARPSAWASRATSGRRLSASSGGRPASGSDILDAAQLYPLPAGQVRATRCQDFCFGVVGGLDDEQPADHVMCLGVGAVAGQRAAAL
jgi:hypothetical protein